MFGFIEFKEDAHKENIQLAHRIKEEVCQLIDNLSKGGFGDRRHEQYPFDERRMGNRMGGQSDMGYGDRRYILDTEPSHYPYTQHPQRFEPRQSQGQGHQFDGRYNY